MEPTTTHGTQAPLADDLSRPATDHPSPASGVETDATGASAVCADLQQWIREKPVQSVLIAGAVGALLGSLLGRRGQSTGDEAPDSAETLAAAAAAAVRGPARDAPARGLRATE